MDDEAINLDLDQITTIELAARESRLYQFSGLAQQKLFFDRLSGSSSAYWTLYDSNNQEVGGSRLDFDFDVTLAEDDNYLLVISNQGNSPLSVEFEVVTPLMTSQNLTLGEAVAGNLNESGEEDIYLFDASGGDKLFYDALDEDFDSIWMELVAPSGEPVIVRRNADYDSGTTTSGTGIPFILPETGEYQLIINANGDVTGDYQFKLANVDEESINLDLDQITTIELAARESQLYQFSGLAEQNIFFERFNGSSSGYWTLGSNAKK